VTETSWWNKISEEDFSQVQGQSFWSDQANMVEVEIPMPESKRAPSPC
jgi:hypothetical protein